MKLSELLNIIEKLVPKYFEVIRIERIDFSTGKSVCVPHYIVGVINTKTDMISSFTLFYPFSFDKKSTIKEIKRELDSLFKEEKTKNGS